MDKWPLAADDQSWGNWLEHLYDLRRDKRGSSERPHKPVLVLRIIELLERDCHHSIAAKKISLPVRKRSHVRTRDCRRSFLLPPERFGKIPFRAAFARASLPGLNARFTALSVQVASSDTEQ
jgi:hypothetical protein